MVLARKQKYRSMEQERKPTHMVTLSDKGGKNIQWRKTASSISGAGKTGQVHEKE